MNRSLAPTRPHLPSDDVATHEAASAQMLTWVPPAALDRRTPTLPIALVAGFSGTSGDARGWRPAALGTPGEQGQHQTPARRPAGIAGFDVVRPALVGYPGGPSARASAQRLGCGRRRFADASDQAMPHTSALEPYPQGTGIGRETLQPEGQGES